MRAPGLIFGSSMTGPRGQDARDLDQVDVADAGREQRVVEGIEGGAAFRVTRRACRHRNRLRHSLLLTEDLASNHRAANQGGEKSSVTLPSRRANAREK
jgi:hypothetical protein